MTQQTKSTLKTAAIVLGAAAAIAGLAYYFKDDKRVKKLLAEAKDMGTDAWDKSKDYYEDTVKHTRKKIKDLV